MTSRLVVPPTAWLTAPHADSTIDAALPLGRSVVVTVADPSCVVAVDRVDHAVQARERRRDPRLRILGRGGAGGGRLAGVDVPASLPPQAETIGATDTHSDENNAIQ